MSFFKTPKLLKKLYPGLLWDNRKGQYLPTSEPHVFLTFDDGPVEEVTDFVLETLGVFKAKGSFFCVGENIAKNPALFKALIKGGHTVGNHTYNHLNGWKSENENYLNNIFACQQLIDHHQYAYGPSGKKLYRPPYGKIKRSQISAINNNYKIVMWDILAGDFNKTFNAEKCLKKTIKHTVNGSIIIFHDSHKAWKNLTYVLPRYLDYLAKMNIRPYAL